VRNCCVIAPMRKPTKPSPTESPLLFEVDPQPIEETLTHWEESSGGPDLPLLGVAQSVKEHVGVKSGTRYDEATFVESFVVLNAAGGECRRILSACVRPWSGEMIGHELPSPAAALQFLYAFHADEKITEASSDVCPSRSPTSQKRRDRWRVGRVNRIWCSATGALSRPAHRHGGSGRHDYRKPQAGSAAHL